jgi:uncharacterized membrane protein YfcA
VEITFGYAAILVVTGVVAGVINTLAGGGTHLTLPALMVMGMPPEVANATNRVGVFLQNMVAMLGFNKYKKLPTDDIGPVLVPTIVGGLFGAVAAAYAPSEILKPLLFTAMITMTLVMVIKPSVISPPAGTEPYKVKDRPSSWFWLTLAGFYGGFVQAGVGFILITALAGSLRYDLVRTNALKVVCVAVFTLMALMVFIFQGLVWWVPGLILASGTMLGAHFAVRFAIAVKPSTLKWFLLIMTICGAIAAYVFD